MKQDNLFPDIQPIENNNTCRTCIHRQRWQCGGRVISYCECYSSNRTENKLMKVKCTNKACCLYKPFK